MTLLSGSSARIVSTRVGRVPRARPASTTNRSGLIWLIDATIWGTVEAWPTTSLVPSRVIRASSASLNSG
jgi:hypothetical protein